MQVDLPGTALQMFQVQLSGNGSAQLTSDTNRLLVHGAGNTSFAAAGHAMDAIIVWNSTGTAAVYAADQVRSPDCI